jgi:hypothetical protein
MNVPQLKTTQAEAYLALKDYRAHRGVFDKQDWEIERIYRAIAHGKTVISVADAIVAAGIDSEGRPRLAFARADWPECRCQRVIDELYFDKPRSGTASKFRIPWLGMRYAPQLAANIPRIPPHFRPKVGVLGKYFLLWEADWRAQPPSDPMLLRRVGKDAWIVLAAWDLTEVEMNVLRAHR